MANSDKKEKQYTLTPGVYIYLRGNYWILRYRIPVEVNGERKLQDQYKRLARREEYDSPRSVEHLAKPYLNSLPDKLTTATTQSVSNFIEHTYFPYAEQKSGLAPSTIFGYKHIFSKHLKHRLETTRLCDFRTATGQQLLNRIQQETELSRTSLKHIKWVLVAILNYAKQVDALQCDGNPMEYTTVPKGEETPETAAYSLSEINTMLDKLSDEPVASAVVATAAFTGLRRSELRGLRWEDLRDNQLFVTRTVWNTNERNKTKTASSKAPVPVLPVLASLLETHRNGFPNDGYIFAGPKTGKPLNLANLARRVIVPKLQKSGVQCWSGWHGFRRGLATNLYELGVNETTIQAIMRHEDVETTRKHYIKKNVVPEESRNAMRRLEVVFTKMQKASRHASKLGTGVGTKEARVETRKRRKQA
ncbi:MAG TPA: tyrosine-type recombinase/integrase [Candidatus Acidoferrales bacterium]|nr:tyrosine-type recombinase/integrase [Candidatus Acidoferrales bacterium]